MRALGCAFIFVIFWNWRTRGDRFIVQLLSAPFRRSCGMCGIAWKTKGSLSIY